MIFSLYITYKKHEMIKIDSQPGENRKYYRKYQNHLMLTALSELDFMYSTKESENKNAECIF